ncbi:MAG: hydroxyphenylacetyl-CoA thioesterase PaaI, partial [Hyphomicrobiales bacterium]
MADEAQELAEECARAMLEEDKASAGLGISLEAIAPGQAELAMTVTENMVNGHNICHGGMIFTLADSAFAFACNTYNQVTVAASAEISFLRPAQLGDKLLAVSHEIWRSGRSGIYDTT